MRPHCPVVPPVLIQRRARTGTPARCAIRATLGYARPSFLTKLANAVYTARATTASPCLQGPGPEHAERHRYLVVARGAVRSWQPSYAFGSPSNHRSTSARRQPTAREPWPPSLTGAGKSPARTRRHNDVRDRPINVSTDGVRRIAGKEFPAVPDGPVERSCLDIEVSVWYVFPSGIPSTYSRRTSCQPSIWLASNSR